MEVSEPVPFGSSTVENEQSSGSPAEHADPGVPTATDVDVENLIPASPEGVGYASEDAAQPGGYELKPEVGAGAAEDRGNAVKHENAAEMAVHSVGYESVNGSADGLVSYQSAGGVENGVPPNETEATDPMQHIEDANTPEEDRLWTMVRANCLDFNAWTALIEETERVAENNIFKIRKVYDAFLAEFPLCFGYWKKYADHEGRLDGVNKVIEVYERAVTAVTYSVDIWLHYCVFAISTYDDPDTIRRYEEAHQAWAHLAMIYTRILENPIQQLDRYFNCLKELSANHPLSEIRTAEEASLMAASMSTDAPSLEGELHPDGVEQPPKPASSGLSEAEELEKYIAVREDLYAKAKEFESKIINFELAVRRPYFHVRPLDDPELENWHNYLDFIEKEDDINKVIKLYERCLIACANYPEFWIRYVLFMESSGNMELAYNALTRATHVFVKKQPDIHLFAAKFKELCGDHEGARAEYEFLYSEVSPSLLEAVIKNANMEYRLGNKDAAYAIYERAIAGEKEKDHSQSLPMLLVQYSRFLYLVAGNHEKAREVLFESIRQVQLSRPLLEAMIHLETIQPQPKCVDYLDSLVEKFISPDSDYPDPAKTSDREDISSIFMEFLDLFGDAQMIKKADNRHAKLFLRQKSSLVSRKRRAEDFLSGDKSKVSRTSADAGSSGHSAAGAYPNAQGQWAAGYAQRPPWPQSSQAQGQQWNPGYTPQVAYSGYGYANYAPAQAPAPASAAPQTAAATAYGSYPSTYPAQAYQPQAYAQPAPAAAVYPQQQASAAAPYYTTGYY